MREGADEGCCADMKFRFNVIPCCPARAVTSKGRDRTVLTLKIEANESTKGSGGGWGVAVMDGRG